MANANQRNPYIIKPVLKALGVLQCLAEAGAELSLVKICKQTRLPKTTAYKYLQTFIEAGYVSYDPEAETYRLGLKLFELGQLISQQMRVQQVALPFMTALRDQFDESVNLAVLDGSQVLCVESVNSTQSLRMQTPPGTREGVHSTSLGKAMLAFLPEEEWDRRLRGPLRAHTARTITQSDKIKAELMRTRARGYAIDDQENTEGAMCVGAPIFNRYGKVEAGISISVPVSRMSAQRQREIAQALMGAAMEISQRLGYAPNGKTALSRKSKRGDE